MLGVGWTMEGLSAITRCPQTFAQDGNRTGITFTSADRFCLDGKRLVTVPGSAAYGASGSEYRTELDGFSKIVAQSASSTGNPSFFVVRTKSGEVMEYGRTPDSAIGANNKDNIIATWALNRVTDSAGNYFEIEYIEAEAGGEYRPSLIKYTGNDAAGVAPYAKVTFGYETRPDRLVGFVADSSIATGMRMTSIVTRVGTSAGETIAREYKLLYYGTTADKPLSRLSHVQVCANEGADGAVSMRCPPATNLAWSGYPSGFDGVSNTGRSASRSEENTMDVDGDGLDDIVYREDPNSTWKILFATGSGFRFVDSDKRTGTGKQAVFDFNGDGRDDLAVLPVCVYVPFNPCSPGQVRILRSTGDSFSEVNTTINYQQTNYQFAGIRAGDVNGDGHTDLLIGENHINKLVIYFNNGAAFTRGETLAEAGWGEARLFDYDGDGRTDLLRRVDETWRVLQSNGAGFVVVDTGITQEHLELADVNGDGLQDAVVDNAGKWAVRLNRGGVFGALYTTIHPADNREYAQVIDFNSDGREDLFVPRNGNWYVLRPSPGGTEFDFISSGLSDAGFDERPQVGDFNGDGLLDLALAIAGKWNLALHRAGNPGLMQSINSGGEKFNDLITVTYLPLTNTTYRPFDDSTPFYTRGNELQCDGAANCKTRGVIAPMYVTASYRKNNGVFNADGSQGSRSYTYAYQDARVHISGRGFLGFAKQTVKDNATSIYTANTYMRDFPFTGMIESTQTFRNDPVTGKLTSVTNRYESISTTTNAIPMFPYMKSSVNSQYDLDDAGLISTTTTENISDTDGNLTDITVSIADGTGVHTTHTVNEYFPANIAAWRLGRLSRSTVTQSSTGKPPITRVATFHYDPGTGILDQEIVEPDIPSLRVQTDYQLNGFGQVEVETVSGSDIEPRITTTSYTPGGRFPLAVKNAEEDRESYRYDSLRGGVQNLTGPNNLPTGWAYDALGRKQTETRADGTSTDIIYGWCNVTICGGPRSQAIYRRVTITRGPSGAPSAPTTIEYFDSLNRVISNETNGFEGTPVFVETEYTGRGEVQRVSRPYKNGAIIKYWTAYLYDDLGRVTRENSPTTGLAEIAYDGLRTTTTRTVRKSDGSTTSQIATETKNARGLTIGTLAPGQIVPTKYDYDPVGNLRVVEDSVGNRTVNVYDAKGYQKIQTTDPDMGLWTYDYSVLGELIKQTDAKNQVSDFKYDRLGRMVERSEPEGATRLITTWAYDIAVKGVSKLASETSRLASKPANSFEFRRTYTYDGFSRPKSTVTTIAGTNYTSTLDYDPASRVSVINYPNNFAVRNVYNAQGYLEQVRNENDASLVYWRAIAVNADGQVTQEYRDEGGSVGGTITVNRGYDPASGRIDTLQTGANNGIQNQDYDFDSLGNLDRRQDFVQGVDETFQYDELNRVTVVGTVIDATALPNKTVAYDSLGNILNKSDVGNYAYDSPRPHAVTSAGGNTYNYDANGSQLTGAGRTLTWNAANLPATISQGGSTLSFSYGPDRARYKQVAVVSGGTETTYYVGGLYEKIIKGSLTTQRYYIQAGQEAIAVQIKRSSGDTSDLRYLFRDHLGSVAVITDRGGVVKERFSYDAWGKRRMLKSTDKLASLVLPYGFTNHEHLDAVGLIHMNGRVYDPILSRFTSADPFVQFPENQQSLNRYSYVLNNPLSAVDPTGLFIDIFDPFEEIIDFGGDVVDYVADNPLVIVGVAAGILTGGAVYAALGQTLFAGVAAGAIGGFTGGLIASGGNFEAALISGITGAAFGFLGAYGPLRAAYTVPRVVIHGLVGGVAAEIQGGRFDQGFISAGAAEVLAPAGNVPGNTVAAGLQRASARAVIGGTVSEISGGKFANGAITAAFVSLFGDLNQGRLTESSTLGESLRGIAVGALDVAGKIWALPNTIIGLSIGGISNIFGGEIGLGHNAIEFRDNALLNLFGGRGAITLGNTIIYGKDAFPYFAPHELIHTYQSQFTGPAYIPLNILGATLSLIGQPIPALQRPNFSPIHGRPNFMEGSPLSSDLYGF